jgi:hypothetical protein
MMVHEMPAAFGEIALLFVDESPLDAFTFGVNTNDPMTLELDALRVPPAAVFTNLAWLMRSRDVLYQALDALSLPADQRGVPVTRAVLQAFQLQHVDGGYFPELLKGMAESIMMAPLYDPRSLHRLEWRGKVEADIRPDMSAKEVEAALAQAGGNAGVVKLATLWSLVAEGGDGGRIQVHRSEEGRRVRMAGLHKVAARWQVPTLVCDGTADAELLRTVWPQLQEPTVMKGWQKLPRTKWVEVYQCVDRSVSKYMVAIEGEGEKRETRIRAARRLWAAVLKKAVEYGARDIGVITYKSTREWIEANCFVPTWIKLLHHGAAPPQRAGEGRGPVRDRETAGAGGGRGAAGRSPVRRAYRGAGLQGQAQGGGDPDRPRRRRQQRGAGRHARALPPTGRAGPAAGDGSRLDPRSRAGAGGSAEGERAAGRPSLDGCAGAGTRPGDPGAVGGPQWRAGLRDASSRRGWRWECVSR